MPVRKSSTSKGGIPLSKRIKFQKARQLYLNVKSDCYLSAPKALERSGYAANTARDLAPLLFEQTESTPELRLDPENVEALVTELNKWLALMSKWREDLEKVKEPSKLSPSVFAVVSAHIERLSKILGLIREQAKGPTLNIQINGLPNAEQYDKLKLMLSVLFEKVRGLESQLEVDASNKFILN